MDCKSIYISSGYLVQRARLTGGSGFLLASGQNVCRRIHLFFGMCFFEKEKFDQVTELETAEDERR